MKNIEVSFSLLELEFHCKNLFFDMGKALVSKNLKSSARPVVASISRQRDTTWSIPLCAPKGARTGAGVRSGGRHTHRRRPCPAHRSSLLSFQKRVSVKQRVRDTCRDTYRCRHFHEFTRAHYHFMHFSWQLHTRSTQMPLRLTVTYGVCKSLWEVHDAQPKLCVISGRALPTEQNRNAL